MAYEQNSAYEPPRRAYMTQRQKPNPALNEYSDYAQGPYDQYNQGYAQDHQQHDGGYDGGYEQRKYTEQESGYDNGYAGGYADQSQNGTHYQRHDVERNYDPRYQPRAQRQPPSSQQRSPPRVGQSMPREDPYRQGPTGVPLQNRRPPPPAIRQQDPYSQQNGYEGPVQSYNDQYERQNGYQEAARPRAQGQQPRYDQSNGSYYGPQPGRENPPPQQREAAQEHRSNKSSMEEWKAQEKAKFQKNAMSPETQNFDNAFPVFGKKAQRDSNRSGGASTPTSRPSIDQGGRPHDRRPPNSRENSYRTQESAQSPPRRVETDRQYLAETGTTRPRTAPANRNEPPMRRSNDQYQYANGATTPVREDYPDSWPMVAGQTPPKTSSQQRSPSQSNGKDPRYASDQQAHTQYSSQYSEPQPLPKQRGHLNMRPIDTSQAQQYQRPVYEQAQPLSPAIVPPRPSTSHASRSAPEHQLHSPLAQQPQSAYPHDNYNDFSAQPQKPWAQEEQQTRHASLGDIYDQYNTTPPRKLQRAPTTRDEEIEAEMPDFDSAAPGQTSSMHKRTQTMDKHLDDSSARTAPPPPMPRTQTAPPAAMLQSQSAHDLRYTQAQYVDQAPAGPPRRVATERAGFAPVPPSALERQYDIPYRNSPAQTPTYVHGESLPLPQAPYASEPQVRRSMDDQSSMPYRQGPPSGPRGPPPNGPFPRGPPAAQGRPVFDRNGTNQTTWSDPGQERVGSAPPLQSGLRGPPGVPGGPPPSQQARIGNPDALPQHPTPVRAGHIQTQSNAQPNKPPPVRNYAAANGAQSAPPRDRQVSVDAFAQPVTFNELERLRASVDNGQSGPKSHLLLVKKLVEASKVLASTSEAGARADPKTTAKNRDRYLSEALKRLKKLVAGGYPSAQFYMADCYGQGMLGLEPDTKEAFKLYQAAAKAGHPQAAYRTAVCCEMGPEEGGGTSKDHAKAVQWYRRAATLGDAAAMYKIGAVLVKGLLGQQRNIGEAVTWLKRGAEIADQDNPHALHELARLYESDNKNPEVRNKIPADDAYAKDLYVKAARLGYKFSQFKLGQAYEYGSLGLPISNRDSIAWYTKAAAQGEHQAELALSGWYLTGAEGILEHSDTEAYLWARKAASSEGGPQVGKAMFAMGYFTENGIGCPKSMEEARKWYGRAASYKFPKALERLEELRKGGGKGGKGPAPVNGKLTRKDQKRDEENCVVM